jgi:phytoene dehydrogenase-like protein
MKDYCEIVLPEGMTRFSQYGEGVEALGANPDDALPPYAIANFTAVDSGLWDEPPHLVAVLGLDRLANWKGLPREESVARRDAWLSAIEKRLDRDCPGFAGLVRERVFLNAHSMAGYLRTPEGAVYGFEPLPPEAPILAGFPRTPHTPVGGLYLASAFGGEHGFNGAILSGAEAARLAARDLESRRLDSGGSGC